MILNLKKREILNNSALFDGVSENDIISMLECLNAVSKKFKKDETIYRIGDFIESIGFVLSGSVSIERYDIWGNRKIIGKISPGDIFGESYACSSEDPLMVNIVSDCDTEILFMNVNRVMAVCSNSCRLHSRIVKNLLNILAHRNLDFTRKIEYLTQKTIREKVLLYLSYEDSKSDSEYFKIPFNRQQLADYLSVDRSALSAELSKMQKDGLIEFKKDIFKIKV
ncbi:Crp/Fnr family transcriptional regulator [Peptacetobacter hominis]|uniref:Crp/Fnr family transcriptional regulator n=1 Tax=Peptacetobacter hominis TaxID=2743610 RepID=A0A544QWM4_9FIRM|nr:Crp/Fnr family transcriptional regulator [Peptacetobacter hominis]TQQ85081.1 Crp/Fnr family transcriptional regulator [Peptacetobacter hominis]